VEKIDKCVGKCTLVATYKNDEDHSTKAFAGVYSPNSDRDRTPLWDELAGILSWSNLPWCVGDDFNVTCFPNERPGEARLCPTMMEFSDFIFNQGLMDLPLVGDTFIWLNNHLPHDSELIDFLSLRCGKLEFLMHPRGGSLDFVWIISLPSFIVVTL
jgi:hypothetical protein